MNRRTARRIALDECAALIQQQLDSPFGFIEANDEITDKVATEATRIVNRLRDQAYRLEEER